MEIIDITATRGATITQNLHKPDVGGAFSFRFRLLRPPYISMRSDMLLDTFLAVLLVM